MDWTEYFCLLFFCSLWCLGVFAISRKGKLFDFVDNWLAKVLDAKPIQKKIDKNEPMTVTEHLKVKLYDWILGCATCSASLHTFYAYALLCYFSGIHWQIWIWVMIAIPCAFVNELFWTFKMSNANKSEYLSERTKIIKNEQKEKEEEKDGVLTSK